MRGGGGYHTLLRTNAGEHTAHTSHCENGKGRRRRGNGGKDENGHAKGIKGFAEKGVLERERGEGERRRRVSQLLSQGGELKQGG